ncbi:MAG: aldolase/citrate lyase family protein, partial [Chloroflexota bacterium]|nr:aldolase/citrate lyase family protein [Chloroflexota bacterium]
MNPYRSILFIPGDRQRMLDKGPTTGADALVLDLEDAVAVQAKTMARQMIREYIPSLGGMPVFVRLNAVSTGLTRADLESVVVPGLTGVFLAKAESSDEVAQVAGWLAELEPAAGVAAGTVDIVCMLESANSVRIGYDIATASPRVASVVCSSGQNGDLQTDLACDWSVEGTE